jgi:Ner family transcriptional regulator
MRTTSRFSTQDPHREELKALIRMRGKSMAELSRDHGYSDEAVRIALMKPWPAVERIIADWLETEPWELWPDRYVGHEPIRGRA